MFVMICCMIVIFLFVFLNVDKCLFGDFVIWFFIMVEMLVFVVFFVFYVFVCVNDVELFNFYQQMFDCNVGVLNIVLLVIGLWFVVFVVQVVYCDDQLVISCNILFGFFCGGGFLVVKVVEYVEKFGVGILLLINIFYMFYILLIFFYFMYVIFGMVIFIVFWVQFCNGVYGSYNVYGLESGVVYWYMVDLLWIIFFLFVYVMC